MQAEVHPPNLDEEFITMDAIVGESYVSRNHSDRNAAESSEITERATRKKRPNAPVGGPSQQRASYGVSVLVNSSSEETIAHSLRCRELISGT